MYERIFSAAKVVNSVVNLADLQLHYPSLRGTIRHAEHVAPHVLESRWVYVLYVTLMSECPLMYLRLRGVHPCEPSWSRTCVG